MIYDDTWTKVDIIEDMREKGHSDEEIANEVGQEAVEEYVRLEREMQE